MATKTCKNGHTYDASIYGQNCPFCPQEEYSSEKTTMNDGNGFQEPFVQSTPYRPERPSAATTPRTPIKDDEDEVKTRIHNLGGNGGSNDNGGGIMVGMLVSYTHNPQGEIFKIYEGANLIGRGGNSTIKIAKDDTMSREHLLIQYVSETGQFAAQDRGSSSGTYVNGKAYNILTPLELKNNDIIVLGRTKFIFLAIPNLRITSAKNS